MKKGYLSYIQLIILFVIGVTIAVLITIKMKGGIMNVVGCIELFSKGTGC